MLSLVGLLGGLLPDFGGLGDIGSIIEVIKQIISFIMGLFK